MSQLCRPQLTQGKTLKITTPPEQPAQNDLYQISLKEIQMPICLIARNCRNTVCEKCVVCNLSKLYILGTKAHSVFCIYTWPICISSSFLKHRFIIRLLLGRRLAVCCAINFTALESSEQNFYVH